MKKLLLVFPLLAIILAGCGNKDGYDKFLAETTAVQDASALQIEFDIDQLSGLKVSLDLTTETIYFNTNGIESYIVDDVIYVSTMGIWAQGKSNDQFVELMNVFEDADSTIDVLPDPDEPFSENHFNIPVIDNIIAGKTPNEVVILLSENQYTIKGAEDILTIYTENDQVKIELELSGQTGTVIISAADPVIVPEEAKDGIDIGVIG